MTDSVSRHLVERQLAAKEKAPVGICCVCLTLTFYIGAIDFSPGRKFIKPDSVIAFLKKHCNTQTKHCILQCFGVKFESCYLMKPFRTNNLNIGIQTQLHITDWHE